MNGVLHTLYAVPHWLYSASYACSYSTVLPYIVYTFMHVDTAFFCTTGS